MLVSGLTPYEITFIGGYDDNKEEGYGKHQDINPETGQKETIKADHLNNIELSIKELRDNSNKLVTEIKESYANLGICFVAKYGDGTTHHDHKDVVIIDTAEYKMREPISVAVYYSDDDQFYTFAPCSGIAYLLSDNYIETIQIQLKEFIDFYYMHINLFAPTTDIAAYNTINGIIPEEKITILSSDEPE